MFADKSFTKLNHVVPPAPQHDAIWRPGLHCEHFAFMFAFVFSLGLG
jgi:hypothetical protein